MLETHRYTPQPGPMSLRGSNMTVCSRGGPIFSGAKGPKCRMLAEASPDGGLCVAKTMGAARTQNDFWRLICRTSLTFYLFILPYRQ